MENINKKHKRKAEVDRFLSRCFSKAEYARKKNISHTWVNKLIESGKLVEVEIAGASFVYEPEEK